MKARISLIACALILGSGFFTSRFVARAQEQGGGGGLSGGGAAASVASNVDTQGIRNYLLGPGDSLDIRVFGQPDMGWTGEVDGEGNIAPPFVDPPIRAQCRTEKDIQKDVVTAYSKYLRNPQVSVRTTQRNSRQPATILGAVRTPTRVQMLRQVRLNELIAVSGGMTERSNGKLTLIHTEDVLCPEPGETVEPRFAADGSPNIKQIKVADLYSGKESSNPVVRPGDIVQALEADPIYIYGEVNAPAPIYLREDTTLTFALAQAGGQTVNANLQKVRIYRRTPGQATSAEPIVVDVEAIKKKKQADILLQPYDIVEIPSKSKWNPGVVLGNLASGLLGFGPQATVQRVIR